MDTWFLDLKSTLDYHMSQATLALQGDYPDLKKADLDDVKQTDEVFASVEPAVIWQNMTCDQSPQDPLWTWKFAVGVKTADDAGNYDLATILSKIMAPWQKNSSIAIYDYSEDTAPTDKRGSGVITMHEVTPQQFDNQAGLRLTVIVVKVVRCA